MRVRQATVEDVPSLVALFQELDRMQADWRVFTPRPGFYDEVGAKYNEALADPDTVVLVAEDEDAEVVGMAYGEARTFPVLRRASPRALGRGRARRLPRPGRGPRAGPRGRRFAADRGVRWVELKTFAPNRARWSSGRTSASPRVVQLTSPTKVLLERLEGR